MFIRNLILLVTLCVYLLACDSSRKTTSESEPMAEDNVLVDYIKEPQDKASKVRDSVENIDKERQRQLDILDQ